MKIKKTSLAAKGTPGATGGAAINDRFRLDPVAPAAANGGTISSKAAAVALSAGIVALLLVGVLTYVLYDHWVFLMPA